MNAYLFWQQFPIWPHNRYLCVTFFFPYKCFTLFFIYFMWILFFVLDFPWLRHHYYELALHRCDIHATKYEKKAAVWFSAPILQWSHFTFGRFEIIVFFLLNLFECHIVFLSFGLLCCCNDDQPFYLTLWHIKTMVMIQYNSLSFFWWQIKKAKFYQENGEIKIHTISTRNEKREKKWTFRSFTHGRMR